MKKYINIFLVDVKSKPQEVFVGICIFFVAFMGTSVYHVASTAFAVLLIASFFIIKDWGDTWKKLNKNEKWLLVGFGVYALSGVVAFINVQDVREYIKDLERYVRFLAAVPIYLYIKKYKINVVKYLYAGAIASGPFLFFIAMRSYMANPEVPAQGQYHHIIFGAVAMLNVGVMLAMLLTLKLSGCLRFFILVALICGFVAAVLSQSRGVWLALPVYIIIALYYSIQSSKVSLGAVLLILVMIFGAIIGSPVGKMIDNRVSVAVKEVSAFYDAGNYVSSVGTRIAMWSIAMDELKKHPFVGSGPGDFDDTIRELQKKGQYKGMDVHISIHSIYFQSLFNAGTIGFLALIFGIIYVPLKTMLAPGGQAKDVSLSGIITILLFAIIGLSMSWTIRSPIIAVYILFLLTIVSGIYSCDDNAARNEN